MSQQQLPSDEVATLGQRTEGVHTQTCTTTEQHLQQASDLGRSAAAATAPGNVVEHAFETDPGDHAETPFEAYDHLDLLLTRLAKRLGTTKAALRIYDPYFCEGRMLQHLARLGYESVYNRNEDFYEVKAAGKCPEYDVLLTNPPFSGDHLERIFRYAVKSNKPWCLLVPQYVSRKAFYLEWLNNHRPKGMPKPSYVAPTQQPYVFTAPSRADVLEIRAKEDEAAAGAAAAATGTSAHDPAAGLEQQLSRLSMADATPSAASTAEAAAAAAAPREGRDSPPATAAAAEGTQAGASPSAPKSGFEVAAGSFQCVWFCSLGELHHKPVVQWVQQQLEQRQALLQQGGAAAAAGLGYCVVSQMKDVPQLMAAPKLTPAERRWRKKQAALAAAGQLPSEQQQQAAESAGGRAGGRQGGSCQQQQQQAGGAGTRQGGRQQQQQHLGGRQPAPGRQQQQHKPSRGSQFSILEQLL